MTPSEWIAVAIEAAALFDAEKEHEHSAMDRLSAAEKLEIGDFPKPRLVKTSLETNTCDWCGETIEQGSTYWFRNDYDAQVTVRMHSECYAAPNVAELLCFPPWKPVTRSR